MAKRRCKHGRRVDGHCRKTPRSHGMSGPQRTCKAYRRVRSGGKTVLRCGKFVGKHGCPPFVGQRHGTAECVCAKKRSSRRTHAAV